EQSSHVGDASMTVIHRTSRRTFVHSAAAVTAGCLLGPRQRTLAAESDLVVRTADPLNSEPPLAALLAAPVTPVKHFYVRNHGPIPKVEGANYKLRIEGLVENPLELTLAEIKDRFRSSSTEATLTCAGNRRKEISAIQEVGGVQWDAGAIG